MCGNRVLILILIFLNVIGFSGLAYAISKEKPTPDNIRAVYLCSSHVFNEKKIVELERLIATTSANAIVIDFKDSNYISPKKQEWMAGLVQRFNKQDAYTIARIVVFQDSFFACLHPEVAVKTSSGQLWTSGRRLWGRYWLDPASSLAREYNIQVAKLAIDAGFDEIQFDYIRFPSDGNMRDICYPFFNSRTMNMEVVMRNVFYEINRSLKAYKPDIVLSVDLFGEVLVFGRVQGIGQNLLDAADYFDVLSPMAYPSHYNCGSFGVHDPNANPYKVYDRTVGEGKRRLADRQVIIRPWIQDFSIANIYRCGPKIIYTAEMVLMQIRASQKHGAKGFMLWNAGSNFTREAFQ